MKSIARISLGFANSFEAELLVHLMLEKWGHPLANDDEFRSSLLESTTEALRAAIAGQVLMEPLKAKQLNFVAALWYVESATLQTENIDAQEREQRELWLEKVRRTLPSCFCSPDDL